MAYRLYNKENGKLLGTITADQLETLVDLLEEEDAVDHDYYIDKDILDYMKENGADEELLALLTPHVGDEDGVEVEWKEEKDEKDEKDETSD